MATNIIDSFFVALGFKFDPAGANLAKKKADEAKESLLSVGTALKVFATGVAIKGIAEIGDKFEQNTVAIAGFLSALGLSSDFNAGLKDAENTLKMINTAAAKLPGEAEDYIEVFRAGLPAVQGAMPTASIKDIVAFTNKFTAIGKTLQVDSSQIGRDLQLLLGPTGRAGATVLTFQRMLAFIKKMPGQANLTAESFNKLSQPARLKLIQDALANPGLTQMLDRSATTFDAMLGAAKSMVKTLIKLSTAGIFSGMKKGLDNLRAFFVDDAGEVTANGKKFIEAGQAIGKVVVQLTSAFAGAVRFVLQNETALKALKVVAIALGVALAGLALSSTTGMLVKMAAAVLNLKKLLFGGLVVALVLAAEDLYMFFTGGDSVTKMLLEKFPIATKAVIAALGLMGAAILATRIKMLVELGLIAARFVATGATAAAAWAAILGPIVLVVAAVAGVIKLIDVLDAKFDIVNKIANKISQITGIARTTTPDSLKNFTAPAFNRAISKEIEPEDFLTKRGSGGSSTTDNSNRSRSTSVGQINIQSSNPRESGRQVVDALRNAQSGIDH
jgi:hypothetical protein